MKARIEDNIVVEIFRPIPGFSLQECYHPSILEGLIEVGDLQVGDVYSSQESVPIFEVPSIISTKD